MKYNVGDVVKLSTDCGGRVGKVLAVKDVLVTVGWANGKKTEFSTRVLDRLSCTASTDANYAEYLVA